jgi:hypothetical protein
MDINRIMFNKNMEIVLQALDNDKLPDLFGIWHSEMMTTAPNLEPKLFSLLQHNGVLAEKGELEKLSLEIRAYLIELHVLLMVIARTISEQVLVTQN